MQRPGYLSRSVSTWNDINERIWQPFIERHTPFSAEKHGMIVRIRPNDDRYKDVIRLRYHSFVESGFLLPSDPPDYNQMQLERDDDSIILGHLFKEELWGTMSLNTPSPRYPGLAMLLEKGFKVEHNEYCSNRSIEICKFAIPSWHGHAVGKWKLLFIMVPMLIGHLLGKHHFWQVVKDHPRDIRFRERMGFSMLPMKFIDRSLNDMPSYVGYFHLYDLVEHAGLVELQRNFARMLFRSATENV